MKHNSVAVVRTKKKNNAIPLESKPLTQILKTILAKMKTSHSIRGLQFQFSFL